MDDVEQLLNELKEQQMVDNGLTQSKNTDTISWKSKKGGKNVTENRRD